MLGCGRLALPCPVMDEVQAGWDVATRGQLPHFSSCWILVRAQPELSAVFLEEGDVGRCRCRCRGT